MRYPYPHIRWQRENGSVAVEAALSISLILVPILTFMLLFGRYFWYYTAAQKAVHDATLSISTLPIADIRSGRAENFAARIIEWETSDLDAMTLSNAGPTVDCWFKFPATATTLSRFNCNTSFATPVVVRTSLTMAVHDPFLSPLIGGDMPIVTEMTMRYVER